MFCENCKEEHDGTYGSGRFCKSQCAKSYSTKAKRADINRAVSEKMKGQKATGKPFTKGSNPKRWAFTASDREKAVKALSDKRLATYSQLKFIELPMAEKRRVILSEQNDCCKGCNIFTWKDKPIVLELHHIDGNNLNNIRENIVFLCPNCHSQTETFRRKKSAIHN